MITPKTVIDKRYGSVSIEEYVWMAGCGSSCAKSNRGVILVSPDAERFVFASNDPPRQYIHPGQQFLCVRDDWCKTNCNKVAVHAEERAIIQAKRDLTGWEMFHGRVDKSEYYKIIPSGPPSCWQCSRMIVEARIAGMWLLHEDGWKRYTAEEFHRLTLEYCMPR